MNDKLKTVGKWIWDKRGVILTILIVVAGPKK